MLIEIRLFNTHHDSTIAATAYDDDDGADLKCDAVDVGIAAELTGDTVLREEIDGMANRRDAKAVMIPPQIVENALVEATLLHNLVHHSLVLDPFLFVLLHCQQIQTLPIYEMKSIKLKQ